MAKLRRRALRRLQVGNDSNYGQRRGREVLHREAGPCKHPKDGETQRNMAKYGETRRNTTKHTEIQRNTTKHDEIHYKLTQPTMQYKQCNSVRTF